MPGQYWVFLDRLRRKKLHFVVWQGSDQRVCYRRPERLRIRTRNLVAARLDDAGSIQASVVPVLDSLPGAGTTFRFLGFLKEAQLDNLADAKTGPKGIKAMKNPIQHISRLSVLLVLAHSLSVAQGIKSPPPSDTSKSESRRVTKTEQEQEMREEQLRTLRTSTLTRTVDSVTKMDEPALRISARIQILKYLALDMPLSEEDKTLANRLGADALVDFSEHADEIMPALSESLLSNLAVWIKNYQPSLGDKLEALEKAKMKGKESQNIRNLMALPGGDVLAAQRIAQSLEEGKDLPVLILYLNDLIAGDSQEVRPLLSKVLEAAAQGRLSFETLHSVSDLYLQPQTPAALTQGFIRMVVARTQPFNFDKEPASQSAYYLLTNLLPAIQKFAPELYGQAANQRQVIYAAFNRDQKADEERNKRLRESSSPAEDLVAEADETKPASKRNELLAQAAQLARENKKFSVCLEAVAKLDLDVAGVSADFWRNWSDQFINEFVKAVLAEKKPEFAEKGIEHISAPYAKVGGLAMVMQYWVKGGDIVSARRLLAQGRKAAGAATDNVEKAKAFLLLTAASDQADNAGKSELLESAIKALNSVSMPERGDDLRPYQRYVWKLNGAEYQVAGRFKDLAKSSNEEALTLIERIDKAESRAFALLGVLQGMRDLSLSRRD